MKSLFRVASIIAGTVAGMGCGSSSAPVSHPPEEKFDALPDLPGPAADASVDAPPITGPGGMRIVPGAVRFLTGGPPCTNDAEAKGDTWCAFLSPSLENPGSEALFVLNVTRALTGVAIKCDSPLGDPNCLLLTRGFGEDTVHKAAFQGNTLVYFDQTASPYAWRPGMLNGRRLAVGFADVHDCTAGRTGDTVACLRDIETPDDVPGGAGSNAVYSELLAGHVGPDSPPLPVVDTVISSDPTDDLSHFQFRIVSALSDRIAWSSRQDPSGPEVLNIQKIGDNSSRQVVATDVTRWTISADGLNWAWLAQFSYDSRDPSGTLQMAPFPGGANPTTLLPKVANFWFAGPRAVGVLRDTGDLSGIPDPVNAPAAVQELDTQVLGVIAASSLGHLAYAKKFDFVFGLVDLHVQKADGTGVNCFLDFREEVPFGNPVNPRFLTGGTEMIWARVTNLDEEFGELRLDGKLTRLSDCSSQIVGRDIAAIGPLGDEGITFMDSYDGTAGTLHIKRVLDDGTLAPGAGTLVQTRMTASLSLYPFVRAVAYAVSIGDPNDGLYLHPVNFPAN